MKSTRKRVSRADFKTFKGGRRFTNNLFSLVDYGGATNKVAVVVSNKIAKGAVRRNHLKRQILSIVRSDTTNTNSLVFYPKKEAVGKRFSVLKESLTSLLKGTPYV